MTRVLSAFVLSLVASLPVAAQTPLPPPASRTVDYDKDVKPLLAQHCYGCHGPEVQQSGLRLDLRQNALRGGDYGPVIIPGKSAESKLIRRLADGKLLARATALWVFIDLTTGRPIRIPNDFMDSFRPNVAAT